MSTERDAHNYTLLQAEEIMLRFERANGRPATSTEELGAWVVDNLPTGLGHTIRLGVVAVHGEEQPEQLASRQ